VSNAARDRVPQLDRRPFAVKSSPVVDADSGNTHTDVFDTKFDTLVSALASAGVDGLPVLDGEVAGRLMATRTPPSAWLITETGGERRHAAAAETVRRWPGA
jgi:hypothetical protein